MNPRSGDILEAVISEFIRQGEPVSSGYLFDNYDFGIRPAMIRLELNDLTDAGYLEQSHHSAGRVPSDRGYAYIAHRAIESQCHGNCVSHEVQAAFKHSNWDGLLEALSRELGVLGVAHLVRERAFIKEGLRNLVDRVMMESPGEISDVVGDFEELDERLPKAESRIKNDDFIEIFVGRESPVTRSPELSVLMADYERDGERTYLLAIGPKRMNYEKAVHIFKALKELQ